MFILPVRCRTGRSNSKNRCWLGCEGRGLTSRKVVLMAHSMGGLDARYAVAKLGMDRHVAAVVTVTTPTSRDTIRRLGHRKSWPAVTRLSVGELSWFGHASRHGSDDRAMQNFQRGSAGCAGRQIFFPSVVPDPGLRFHRLHFRRFV